VAAGVEIRAVTQATKPVVPPAGAQAPPTTAAKPGTSSQGTSSQGTATQGAAGRGANAQPQGRGDAGRQGGSPTGPGPGGRDMTPWWKDEAVKKEIGLRDDQAKRIDDLFAQRAKDIEPLKREYDVQRAGLDRLMSDRTTDMRTALRAIELQVALMEVPRVKMNESLNVMLYRMRRVLEPEQDKKLQAVLDRRSGRGGNH
jgi:Spy/CpxP family protein refolding chaperone